MTEGENANAEADLPSDPVVSLDEPSGPESFTSTAGSKLELKYVGKSGECALLFTTLDGETSESEICSGVPTDIGGWQVGLVSLFEAGATVLVTDPDGEAHGSG